MLFGIQFFIYFIVSFATNELVNKNRTIATILEKPSFVEVPYILLMFNGTSDLEDYATFSEYRDKDKRTKKYRGSWSVGRTTSTPFINDYALVMTGEKSYSAISFELIRPFRFNSKCLIVQYDVRFPTDHECGGAYIKLLSESVSIDLKYFSNSTPYTILFGPDKCGLDFEIKFIFQYKDSVSKENKERKFKKKEKKYPRYIGDNVTHVYTLIICENNSVQILKDLRLVQEGNLLSDFEPKIGGEPYIVDVNDFKPNDWNDEVEIADHSARKPDDWDEDQPEFIPDEDAVKPKNWLENEPLMVKSKQQEPGNRVAENDVKWKPPMIKNFKCKLNGCGPWKPPKIRNTRFKGKWKAPLIKNPNYIGEWKPREIENPAFKAESDVYRKLTPFVALGIEILSQDAGIFFDNFLITDNLTSAKLLAMHTWWPKFKVDTVDMPHYQDIFNKTKKPHKLSLFEYTHWFCATIPLIFGIPFLTYIALLILKKSCRNPDLTREKYLFQIYNIMKKNYELDPNGAEEEYLDSSILSKEILTEVSDEAINQMYGGSSDRIASIIRQRISHKIQSPN